MEGAQILEVCFLWRPLADLGEQTGGRVDIAGSDGVGDPVFGHIGPVQAQESPEFRQGTRMVVDTQVDEGEGGRVGTDDQESGGLAAPDIAAFCFGSVEGGKETSREVAGRGAVSLGHGLPHGGPGHHVGQRGESVSGDGAGLRQAARAGMNGHFTAGTDDGHLAEIAAVVCCEEGGKGFLRALLAPQEAKPQGAVTAFGHGLGGDGADAGLGPGYPGADGQIAGLYGNPHLAGLRIAGDDGVGHR